MIHIRAASSPDATDQLAHELLQHDAVFNLAVVRQERQSSPNDTLLLDVENRAANEVLGILRAYGVDGDASIAMGHVDVMAGPRVVDAPQRVHQDLEPIWAEVEAGMRHDEPYPPSWFMLVAIAGVIAASGLITNSQLLIVGAMVVGPDYGAISAATLGLMRPANPRRIRGAFGALVVAYAGAIIFSALFTVPVRWFGLAPPAYELGARPVTALVETPGFFSLAVAVLAGVAAVVSLSESRHATMTGVFISVTTIPAAANIGVSAVYGRWGEVVASLSQLLLNVVVLVLVGAGTLKLVRRFWSQRGPLR